MDDACDDGACDVNRDVRLDYLRLEADGWRKVDSLALPAGIQQNVGSVLVGDRVYSYGVDSGARRLVECFRDLASGQKGCSPVPIDVGAAANYVGAAVSPDGHRMAWLTNVGDGGGGSFSMFANYGAGWNGPRTGAVGGYNDASYVHVSFGVDGQKDRFVMHGELVAGVAPNWSFTAGVGMGDVGKANAVTWTTPLNVPVAQGSVLSTNDVAVDPATGDTHLVARTRSGDAAYFFRPKGGDFGPALQVFPGVYRARLVFLADGTLTLARNAWGHGLVVQASPLASRTAGSAVDWRAVPEITPTLPPAYGDLYAIYTESSSTQAGPVSALGLALVSRTKEREVLHVEMDFAP